MRAAFGPVAAPIHGADDIAKMFSPNVYEGGALVLYALRQVVGDPTFREIERKWPRRYGGGSASTADFIAFASRIAHRDLTAFLTDWLYATTTPPMPGHPDWTVDPVGRPATKAAGPASSAGQSLLLPAFRRYGCCQDGGVDDRVPGAHHHPLRRLPQAQEAVAVERPRGFSTGVARQGGPLPSCGIPP